MNKYFIYFTPICNYYNTFPFYKAPSFTKSNFMSVKNLKSLSLFSPALADVYLKWGTIQMSSEREAVAPAPDHQNSVVAKVTACVFVQHQQLFSIFHLKNNKFICSTRIKQQTQGKVFVTDGKQYFLSQIFESLYCMVINV